MKKSDRNIEEGNIKCIGRQLDDTISKISSSESISNDDISKINALRIQLNTRKNWLRYRMSESPQKEVLEYQYEFAR